MDKKTRSNNLGVVIRNPITDAATLTPTDIENLERPCGRGVMLIRPYMHEVEYFAPGNAVLMRRIFQKVT